MVIIKWLIKLFEHKEKVYCDECKYYSSLSRYTNMGASECYKIIKYKSTVYSQYGTPIHACPDMHNMFNHCKYYESDKEDIK